MPTFYIGGSASHPLPAFPMRAACSHLRGSFETDGELLQVRLDDQQCIKPSYALGGFM